MSTLRTAFPASREESLRRKLAEVEAEESPERREMLAWQLRSSPGWGKTHGRVIRRAAYLWVLAWDELPESKQKERSYWRIARWLRLTYRGAVPIPGAPPPKTRRKRKAQ